jgi:hypothetical protein
MCEHGTYGDYIAEPVRKSSRVRKAVNYNLDSLCNEDCEHDVVRKKRRDSIQTEDTTDSDLDDSRYRQASGSGAASKCIIFWILHDTV